MTKLLLITLAVLLFGGCTATAPPKPTKTIRARLTFYGGAPEGTASPHTVRATEGVSIAAHPKYPFTTNVSIPQLAAHMSDGDSHFTVDDRGSAVTSRKASRGRADVFDVYVASKKKLRYLSNHVEEYMTVYVF